MNAPKAMQTQEKGSFTRRTMYPSVAEIERYARPMSVLEETCAHTMAGDQR